MHSVRTVLSIELIITSAFSQWNLLKSKKKISSFLSKTQCNIQCEDIPKCPPSNHFCNKTYKRCTHKDLYTHENPCLPCTFSLYSRKSCAQLLKREKIFFFCCCHDAYVHPTNQPTVVFCEFTSINVNTII